MPYKAQVILSSFFRSICIFKVHTLIRGESSESLSVNICENSTALNFYLEAFTLNLITMEKRLPWRSGDTILLCRVKSWYATSVLAS